jgi:hypothetical protein
MAGVGYLDGEQVYFHLDSPDGPEARSYGLYSISPATLTILEERHLEWNRCCGNYSYDLPPGHVATGKVHEYHQKYPISFDPPMSENELLGYIHETDLIEPKKEQA